MKLHWIDLAPADIEPPKPFWMLALHAGTDNIAPLEISVACDLAVSVYEQPLGPNMPFAYVAEDDARRVAVGIMRRRPELRIDVVCSDPAIASYTPLAHTEINVILREP